MILEFFVEIKPELFKESIPIRIYIESKKGKIVSSGIDEEYFFRFQDMFNRIYELEYGTNRRLYINDEFDKYIDEIKQKIQKEIEKEEQRIAKLLNTVTPETLSYLNKVEENRLQMEHEQKYY